MVHQAVCHPADQERHTYTTLSLFVCASFYPHRVMISCRCTRVPPIRYFSVLNLLVSIRCQTAAAVGPIPEPARLALSDIGHHHCGRGDDRCLSSTAVTRGPKMMLTWKQASPFQDIPWYLVSPQITTLWIPPSRAVYSGFNE